MKKTCENCGKEWDADKNCRKFCSTRCTHEGLRVSIEESFWLKVEILEGDLCWRWTGAIGGGGYGALGIPQRRAHRVSWELHYGPIPPGILVLHSCDNPPCPRPDHLFLGTQVDNVHDMLQKGRGQTGEKHHWAKLNFCIASEIRESSGPASAVAAKFGISERYVYKLRNGDTWRYVSR